MGLISQNWAKAYTNNMAQQECAICLEDFKKGEEVVELKCDKKHIFHRRCLQKWGENHSTCPLC